MLSLHSALSQRLARRGAAVVRAVSARPQVTVKHITVWTDRSPVRLTAFVVASPGTTGRLQVYLSGRPMEADPDLPGVWGIDLVNRPRWAEAPLPLASGELRVAATVDGNQVGVRSTCSPSVVVGGVRLLMEGGHHMRVLAPQPDETRTAVEKVQVSAAVAAELSPLVDTVYVEAFQGRRAGYPADSPGAVARHLAEHHPDLPVAWGCRDGYALAQVPDGQRGLLLGSREWSRFVHTARYLVVNDWLDPRFVKRAGQRVLQCWHGTMYKTVGLDRADLTTERAAATLRQAQSWDVLCSQNPHSTGVFRSAYGWTGPILPGYPRNDRLVRGELDRAAVRERLGIAPGSTAVLYAPTWRERPLDPDVVVSAAELADLLDERFVVLARAHARMTSFARAHPRVVDVTAHPDLSALMAASDALVTDYSSIMFDYAATGRPLVFLTPDLAAYASRRGVHLDLVREAPGPVCRTVAEAVHELAAITPGLCADQTPWAFRYRSWQRSYLPWDDGRATERAVAALLDEPAQNTGLPPVTPSTVPLT